MAGQRMLWHSTAISGPFIAERIRRVLDLPAAERVKPLAKAVRVILLSAGITSLWISTAVKIGSAVGAQSTTPSDVADGYQLGFLGDGGLPDQTYASGDQRD
jgi:hypothetical protein